MLIKLWTIPLMRSTPKLVCQFLHSIKIMLMLKQNGLYSWYMKYEFCQNKIIRSYMYIYISQIWLL